MPSSPLSPDCRPECRTPALARQALTVLLVIAISCIIGSDTGLLWQAILTGAALFEAWVGLKSISDFKPFTLQRDAADGYCMDDGCGLKPISGVHWRDFGYLAIQHYHQDGRRRAALWWLLLMPVRQRRQLRLWMNVPATRDVAELPSILVNPVS